ILCRSLQTVWNSVSNKPSRVSIHGDRSHPRPSVFGCSSLRRRKRKDHSRSSRHSTEPSQQHRAATRCRRLRRTRPSPIRPRHATHHRASRHHPSEHWQCPELLLSFLQRRPPSQRQLQISEKCRALFPPSCIALYGSIAWRATWFRELGGTCGVLAKLASAQLRADAVTEQVDAGCWPQRTSH